MEHPEEWVELDLGGAHGTWFRMPATTVPPHESTTSSPTVGVSFTGHHRAVIETASGRREVIEVAPNATFVSCDEPFDWVRVCEPYEGVEIELSPELIGEIARETGVPVGATAVNFRLAHDPVFWAVAVRVRQHALGARALGDLEGDQLVRSALTHVACEHLGGQASRQNARPLDGRRLARVVDYVDIHLGDRLSVSDLADTAAMSTSHFHEAFRRATGLTPHAFVTARRIERARALMRGGSTREAAARAVGYTAGHGFRRALARFG